MEAWLTNWQELVDKWAEQGYEGLAADEKVWLNLRSLIDSVQNGGVISYFYNSGADHLDDCLVALDLLGAGDVRMEVERVSALFPEGVPNTVEERNEVIDSWDQEDPQIDDLLEEVDSQLMPMMTDLETRLERFIRKAGLTS